MGINPYRADPGFFAPPWALYAVYPLAPLPERVATILWLLIIIGASLASLHCAASIFDVPTGRRRSLLLLILLLIPYSLHTLFSGNYTPLVMLGLVTAFAYEQPAASLLLLSLKPQLGGLPVLILIGRLVKMRRWGKLVWSMSLSLAMIAASFLIVPGSFSEYSAGLSARRSLRVHPEWITTIPKALSQIGLDEAYIWPIYLAVSVAVVGLLAVRRDLAMVTTCSLLTAPYAREYDYVLLTIPALYLLQRGVARPIVWLSLLWPLHRIFVGDLSWSWLSIFAPVILLALLIWETKQTKAASL